MWLLCLLLMVGGIQGERFPHLDKPSWLDPGWTPLVHDGRYRLSGRVFWADTGQGQKGVVLAARSEGRGLVFRSVTGADGVFVFCDVPAGIYKLDPMLFWASCPPSASAYPGGLPVLRAAAERTGLVCQVGIPLVRGIPVYGRVLGLMAVPRWFRPGYWPWWLTGAVLYRAATGRSNIRWMFWGAFEYQVWEGRDLPAAFWWRTRPGSGMSCRR